MNRAERRRQGVKQPPPRMRHLTEQDYENRINQAYRKGVDVGYEKAANYAVAYMLAVPLLVLNEHFGEIRLKEYNGVSRIEHFFELCTDVFDEYNSDENTLERLMKDVFEKTGFDISKRVYAE